MVVTAAVEGDIDAAVVDRLFVESGAVTGPIHGRTGRPAVLANLSGYNYAARFAPWVVLVDLDSDDCAPKVVREALPSPAPLMRFRVAVREIEAWLLADRDRMARYLGIAPTRITNEPDDLPAPKEEVVALARSSSKRRIKLDIVPRPGSGRPTGPLYNSSLVGFVQDTTDGWRPSVAATRSPSLTKALSAIQTLIAAADAPFSGTA